MFAKAPLPGTVKTRLIPALGAEGAARLHEHLVRRTLSTVARAEAGVVQLWCSPTPSHDLFRELRAAHGVAAFTQRGADLGERMSGALDTALARASSALLLGTDCADLTAQDLRTASRALASGCDAVLGPAADGGYVLIGLRKQAPALFRDMPWGTGEVLDLTRQVLGRLGLRWYELDVRHDMDRPEDLALLASEDLARLREGREL